MYDVISEEDAIIKYEYLITANIKKYFYGFAKVNENDIDDIKQECRMAIVNALKSYRSIDKDKDEEQFRYYCSKCIYNAILTYINWKHYNKNSEISLQKPIIKEGIESGTIEDFIETYDDISNIFVRDIFRFAYSLGEEYYKILCYIYQGYNQKEIAELMNINYRKLNNKVVFLKEAIREEFNIQHKPRQSKGGVIAYTDDGNYYEEFDNLNEASKKLGIDSHSIRKIAQGVKSRKSAKSKTLGIKIKFKWRDIYE